MKKIIFSALALMATMVYAKPKIDWVPEKSDLVIVGHNLQKDDRATTKAWNDSIAKITGETIENCNNEILRELKAEFPEVVDLYKAFGFSEDLSKHTIDSIVAAVRFPPTIESDSCVFTLTIDFATAIDQPAVYTAIGKIIRTYGELKSAELKNRGLWKVLEMQEEDDDSKEVDAYLAIRLEEKRFHMILTDEHAAFDSLVSDKPFRSITEDSPLAKAFKAPNEFGSISMVLNDFSSAIQRDKDALKNIQRYAPAFATMRDILFTLKTEDTAFVFDVVMNNATAEGAQSAYEMFLGWRMMARTFIAQLFPVDATIVKDFNAIKIDRKDTAITLNFSLTPSALEAYMNDIQKLQMKQQAMMGSGDYYDATDCELSDDDLFDGDDLFDDDDDDEMSEEEMKAILNALEGDTPATPVK